MIDYTLKFLAEELNRSLKLSFGIDEDMATLGPIVNETGSIPEQNKNKMALTFLTVEVDTARQYVARSTSARNVTASESIPYNLNIYVLATSVFDDYNEALKFLSETIRFFKERNIFTRESSPNLPLIIKKLTVEPVNINYQEMQDLWTALGAKHMPSVLFKVRTIFIQPGESISGTPAIEEVMSNDHPS
jgi:hypothetical protein